MAKKEKVERIGNSTPNVDAVRPGQSWLPKRIGWESVRIVREDTAHNRFAVRRDRAGEREVFMRPRTLLRHYKAIAP